MPIKRKSKAKSADPSSVVRKGEFTKVKKKKAAPKPASPVVGRVREVIKSLEGKKRRKKARKVHEMTPAEYRRYKNAEEARKQGSVVRKGEY